MTRRYLTAAILGTLFLTSCNKAGSARPALTLTPDPAKAGPCLDVVVVAPQGLAPLDPFTIPAGTIATYDDGRKVALPEPVTVTPLNVVLARDGKTSAAYLSERAARQTCQSYAHYVVDWTAEATKARSDK